jgi:hypothetical protein
MASGFLGRGQGWVGRRLAELQAARLARDLGRAAPPPAGRRPVVFFNASTRLSGLSLNAAFSLLASWAVRLAGAPVIHFACEAGMSRCVLGTNQDDLSQPPPCRACIRQSRLNYAHADARWFSYQRDESLAASLSGLGLDELTSYQYSVNSKQLTVAEHCLLDTDHFPLGALVLPSIRWRLRLHTLQDDEPTRTLYREYILSAWNVACRFSALLDRADPQAVVVFNGQFFPEATARFLAQQRGIKVITHEVGFPPLSGFFTTGEATIYPIAIPDDFDLDAGQNARLDAYLEQRFQGQFSMAGIRFWPEMKGLDAAFLQKAAGFEQIVPVFTNVIFDTSQPHSNVVFPTMFAWLDTVLEAARQHPGTLFVIRAHPDEARPGKSSRETVAAWVQESGAAALPNIVFIPPDEYLSSYELIQRSKFVMVYNSTIGLEASILGAAVLCAGKARFTQYPTVFFPRTQAEFRKTFEELLTAKGVAAPPEHRRQSRRFLYTQVFRSSLPFGGWLEATATRGYVRFKRFGAGSLRPEASPTVRALLDGIFADGDFLVE